MLWLYLLPVCPLYSLPDGIKTIQHYKKGRWKSIMLGQYPDILDIEDLCEVLRIGKNQAYSLLHTGQIGSFRIGRVWKIPKIALEAYLLKQSGERP